MPDSKAYYIPWGPANLIPIFSGVDFTQVEEYYIEVLDNGLPQNVIATTPPNLVDICFPDDKVRIHFLNYLGAIDALNFKMVDRQHEPTSNEYQKPTASPLIPNEHSINRFNVKSNDTFIVSHTMDIIDEFQKNYFDEILDSPVAWIDNLLPFINYIPIVILSKKTQKFKFEDRYVWELTLEFKLSHEKIVIRN